METLESEDHAVNGYQPTPEDLVHAAREAKSQNPEFGVKRIWGLMKEKGWVVSEQRVKKVMQEIGLTESSSANGSDIILKESEHFKETKNIQQPVRDICSVCTHTQCLLTLKWSRTVSRKRKRRKRSKMRSRQVCYIIFKTFICPYKFLNLRAECTELIGKVQTWPEPTVPIMDLYPSGDFPPGQICEYLGL
jgi:hypothetical protein